MDRNVKSRIVSYAAGAALAVGIALPGTAAAQSWSDFVLGYRYSTQFTEPGIEANIAKSIVNATFANGWEYGSNFGNLDILFSDSNDPAAPVSPQNTGPGATEFYAVWRSQISLAKTTGWKTNAWGGIFRDFSLYGGVDWNTKNTNFAPAVFKWMGGPAVNFNIPDGFLDLAIMWRGENNHNGITNTDVNFSPTWQIEIPWLIPLPSIRSKFAGYMDWIGPKGKDGFGQQTVTEYHLNAYLFLDVGSFLGKPRIAFAGIGYEYWLNKFGVSSANAPGTKTTAPMIAFEFHL